MPRRIKRIDLSTLHQSELGKQEQEALTGGCIWCWCGCGCEYAGDDTGSGKYYGSSTSNNDNANDSKKDGGSWY